MTSSSCHIPSTDLISIDRVVNSIDFIDGFLSILELDSASRRPSVEDKCSLISDCFLPLALIDSACSLVARQSNNYAEDFARTIPTKNMFVLPTVLLSIPSETSSFLLVLQSSARTSRRELLLPPSILSCELN